MFCLALFQCRGYKHRAFLNAFILMKRIAMMKNDTPVFHAFDLYGQWVGMGTREAIEKRRLHGDGIVFWCPHELLIDGWRDR
jgi:hypothetical protein